MASLLEQPMKAPRPACKNTTLGCSRQLKKKNPRSLLGHATAPVRQKSYHPAEHRHAPGSIITGKSSSIHRAEPQVKISKVWLAASPGASSLADLFAGAHLDSALPASDTPARAPAHPHPALFSNNAPRHLSTPSCANTFKSRSFGTFQHTAPRP